MKINRQEFVAALEKVRPGLANKELIEQSTSFAFIKDRVFTYNDEISISHPIHNFDMTGAVKAQLLYTFLGKIKQDEIDVEKEENQIIVKAGRSTAGFVLEQDIKLPVQEEIGKIKDWQTLPDDLIDALKFCYPCCSNDMNHAVLTCIHINNNLIEATDSYQIIQYMIKTACPFNSLLIPISAVKELIKYPINQIAKKGNWVHFKTTDGTIFSSRIIEDTFPDVAAHLKVKGESFIFPPTVYDILNRAQIFSKNMLDKGEVPSTTIEIGEKRLKITAKNEHGWFEESTQAKYTGTPITFIIGIDFLIRLLEKEQKCIIGKNIIKFTGENWQHVIAAMLNDKEENA